MRTPEMFISGIGVHLPDTVSIAQAVADGRYPAKLVDLHGLTGAAVAGDTPAPELALRAATLALTRAAHPPTDLDLLLYSASWHQGPDGWLPQYYLLRHLTGDAPLAVDVHGCNGMFLALELAASYLTARPDRHTALLVAADNFGTALLDRWQGGGASYVMGDAGSAVVLTTRPGFARLLTVRTVAIPEAEELQRAGEALFPPGATVGRPVDFVARGEAFQKQLAESGDLAALARIGGEVNDLAHLALEECELAIGDVTRIATMNCARPVTERLMASFGRSLADSVFDWGRTVGHLGASDQVAALDHLVATGQVGPGDRVLMLGVGPGVTVSCAVVEIVDVPAWAR
ncbi:ketoacyl-ACP synthase III family protein [Streptomyces sp. 7R007]